MRIGCKNDLRIVIVNNDIGFLGGTVLGDDLHMRLMAGTIVGAVVAVTHGECRPIGVEKVIWQAVIIVGIGLLVGCAKLWLYWPIVRANNDVFMLRVQFAYIVVVVAVGIRIGVAVAIVASTAVANIGGIIVIYKYIAIGRGLR